MTTMEKVCQIVLKFKKGKIAAESLKATAALKEDLALDSLDLSELLVLAEDAFKIAIPLEDAGKMKTLGDVTQYIDNRISA